MKRDNNIVNRTLVAVMVFGTLFSFYILFHLTSDLEQASARIDVIAITEASALLNQVYLVIGLTLLLGLGTCLLLLFSLSIEKKHAVISAAKNGLDTTYPSLNSKEQDNHKKQTIDRSREIRLAARNVKEPKLRQQKLLSKLCMELEASQGLCYEVKKYKSRNYVELIASFAFNIPKDEVITYDFGDGLIGQVAKTGQKMNLDNVPDGYIEISSGLGAASPKNLLIIPIFKANKVVAVVEIASFKEISSYDEKLIDDSFTPYAENIGKLAARVQRSKLRKSKQPDWIDN